MGGESRPVSAAFVLGLGNAARSGRAQPQAAPPRLLFFEHPAAMSTKGLSVLKAGAAYCAPGRVSVVGSYDGDDLAEDGHLVHEDRFVGVVLRLEAEMPVFFIKALDGGVAAD